jgi:DNA-directed RNA polymerase subunit K/omega
MADTDDLPGSEDQTEPGAPLPKAPPIESRFLYVDVAALRAKQLRRGARARLDHAEQPVATKFIKAERVAMEEVRQNLVLWDLPEFKAVVDIR